MRALLSIPIVLAIPLAVDTAAAAGDGPGGFDPVAGRLVAAQNAYAAGELGSAHDFLRQAVEETPSEPEPRLWLARVLNDLGHGAEAEEVLNPALAALPSAPRFLTESARSLVLQGELGAAESTYRKALEIYPRCGPARVGLCKLQLEAKKVADAELTLAPLFEQAPEEPAVVVLMAIVLASDERPKQAIALLADRLRGAQSQPELRLALARIELDAGDPAAAWDAIEPLLDTTRKVQNLLFVARVAQSAERPLDALAALGSALAIDPTDSHVLSELNHLLARRGDLRDELVRRRVDSGAQDIPAWVALLEYELERGPENFFLRWENVTAELRSEPQLALLHGIALRRVGRIAEGRALLSDLCADAQDSTQGDHSSRACYELGLLEYAADDSEAAVAAFERGASGSWAADAHFNRGVCLDRLQRYSEAVLAYESAVKLRPDFTEAWLQIGADYRFRLAQTEQARQAYRRYLETGGDDPEVRRYLGRDE